MRLIKYNQLEVQFAYLVNFAQFLLRFAPHLTFLHSKLVLHSLESLFTRVRLHLCSYLVLYLQLVGSEGAQKILPARGTACIFSRLCPIFNTVSTRSDFSALQISLTLPGIIFHKSTFTSIFFIWSSTYSWQDLKRLIKYNQLEVQFAYLVNFAQFLLRFAPHLTFFLLQISLTLQGITFSLIHLHFVISYLVLNLWLVGSQEAQKILEIQLAYLIDFAKFLLQPVLHFTFQPFQSYTTLESLFSRISSCSLVVYLPLLI